MPPYKERFPIGTPIRIVGLDKLQAFKRDWKYHHPLSAAQLPYAGAVDVVRATGFYHGGDVIYQLEKAPGTWHEELLEPN